MSQADLAMHYVCTHRRAQELILARDRFWVSNCGCRESRNRCARSRMDVCLIFAPDDPGSGSGKKEAGLADVMDILREAEIKHLVARLPGLTATRPGPIPTASASAVTIAAGTLPTQASDATRATWPQTLILTYAPTADPVWTSATFTPG